MLLGQNVCVVIGLCCLPLPGFSLIPRTRVALEVWLKLMLVLLCENPDLPWDLADIAASASTIVEIKKDSQQIIETLLHSAHQGDQIVIMSNGGFENIHQRLIAALQN